MPAACRNGQRPQPTNPLFTLTLADGSPAVSSSIGLAVVVMFAFKFVGANLFRVYLNLTEGKNSDNTQHATTPSTQEQAK